MKKLFFLLLTVFMLAGFVSAGSTANPNEAVGFITEMPGNITGFCNVTPGTDSITIPLYAEINVETNSVLYVIKIITNETEYLTNISNYGTFESLFLTFENGFISGGLSLRGA